MEPREIILKAFEGGRPERVPVTLLAAHVEHHRLWFAFEALGKDPQDGRYVLKEAARIEATLSM